MKKIFFDTVMTTMKALAVQCVFAAGFLTIGFAGYLKTHETVILSTESDNEKDDIGETIRSGTAQISDPVHRAYVIPDGLFFQPFDRCGSIDSRELYIDQRGSGMMYLHITENIDMPILKPGCSARTSIRGHNRKDRLLNRPNGRIRATISL